MRYRTAFSARNLRFSKRYLVVGDGQHFFHLLSPKQGWRFWLEKSIFRISHVPSFRSAHIHQRISDALGEVQSFLLYNTSDYKNTSWIGVTKTKAGLICFVKIYKDPRDAQENFRISQQAEELFSSFFTVSSALQCRDSILSFSLLQKSRNVSIEEVWPHVLKQSIALYRQGVESERWVSDVMWAPEELRICREVWGHGDLSHWNCFWNQEDEICLIDYEEVDRYPPLYDCFHLLLKPTLLHRPAQIPVLQCEEMAHALELSIDHIFVWLDLYLSLENRKDIHRNKVLQSEEIRRTIENRRKTQECCREMLKN